MKMTRRVLALLLALSLMFGNVMPAMATELEEEVPAVTEETPVVPEVVETEAPTEEPTEAPVVETEAPTEAPVVETEAPVEETIAQIVDEAANEVADYSGRYYIAAIRSSGNYCYMTSDLGTASTKRYQAEDSGLAVLPTSIEGGEADKIFVLNANTDGTYTICVDGGDYLGHTSGNSGTLVDAASALKVTVDKQEDGTFLIHFTASDTERYLALNTKADYNYFAWYKETSNQIVNLNLIPVSGTSCSHSWVAGAVTAPTCTTDGYTTYTCGLCGDTKTGNTVPAGHSYGDDGICTGCGATAVTLPEDGATLTIAEVLALSDVLTGDTTQKYYVTGVIKNVYNTTYGNMYIQDGEGNELCVYGVYSADGTVRYDAMETKPVAGDTITVYGILGVYNGKAQVESGWLTAHTPATPVDPDPNPDEPAAGLEEGVAYTISAANANGTLWFSGSVTDGRFDGTYTESEAALVYAENVTGGFLLYMLDGETKSYICIEDNSAGGSIGTDAATATVFEWNAEKATAAVAEDGNNRGFGCGATSTYANFSAYDLSGTYNWGQFVAVDGGSTEPEPDPNQPGSEANPITPEWSWNEAQTEATATVAGSADASVFISLTFGGMELTVNNNAPVAVTGSRWMPQIVELSGAESYSLKLTYPAGAMDNPVALADGANTANIAAGSQGYFYTWTASADGKLTVEISATPGWTYAINNLTSYVYGDQQYSEYHEKDINGEIVSTIYGENPAVLDVAKGDELQIMVNTYDPADPWTAPAGTITVTTSFAALGSEANPIDLSADLVYEGDFTATVTVPANTTYYYQAYRVGGMYLYINGTEDSILGGNMMFPATFSVTNDTSAEAEFTLTVAYPVGSMMNPETLEEGQSLVSIAAGNGEGHFYTWTAPARGTLTVEISATPGWTYTINNLTKNVYGDKQYSEYHEIDWVTGEIISTTHGEHPAVIEVSEGDELEIIVNTYDPADEWNTPAGDVSMNVTFEAAQGSSLMPDTMNVAEYEWETSENIVDIPEGIDGYFFTWTAYASGKLTIDVSNGKAGWAYQIQNLTPRAIGEWHYSYDVPTVNSETIYVNEGETIAVVVNTCGETAEDITPAGSVYFYATFVEGVGTEENPLAPEWIWNEAGTEATATVTVPADSSIFVAFDNEGMMLSINDGEPEVITGNWYVPQVMELTAEEAETVYTLKLTYPVGSAENPAEIVMGDNVAIVPDTGAGYNYTFTAEENGTFTFNMTSASNWVYTLNVIRGYDEEWDFPIYEYGEAMMASYGDPAEAIVDLEAGQTIELAIATEDYAADEITFTADFTPALGTASNPEQLILTGRDDWFFNYELAPGQSYTYVGRGLGGMIMWSWISDKGVTVTVDGETYTSKGDTLEVLIPGMLGNPRATTTITFTNNTEDYQAYEFIFEYPYGSEMNPAEMVIGKNTIKLAANDMDGHSFLFYPNGLGYLTLTMNTSSNWTYVANIVEWDDEMQMFVPVKSGDIQLSSNKDAKKSQTIELEGGQMVMMTVGTENRKAGTITFTAAFANKMVDVLAGKSTTLSFTDPKTGKAVAASNVNWQIIDIYNADGEFLEGAYDAEDNLIPEKVAEYATISAGKLTTKTSDEWHCVVVEAALKSDENVTNQFVVAIWPAVTSIQLNQVKGMYWVDGYWDENDNWVDGYNEYAWDEVLKENVTEVTVVANGDTVWLDALVGPEAAKQELIWKSSNPKLVDVGEFYPEDVDGSYLGVYATGYNEKTGKCSTGTATLTGTAADGSGKKVTIKVKVVLDTKDIFVYTKNGQYNLASGKSLPMIVSLETWYNQAPTNKTVTWSMKMRGDVWTPDPNGNDEKWIEDETYLDGGYWERGDWNLVEVPASIATLSKTGVLKAAAGLKDNYEIRVFATVTNSDGSELTNYQHVYLQPAVTDIELYNIPATYDVNFSTDVYPDAYAYFEKTDEFGNTNRYGIGNVLWTVSNTKIAQMVELDEPHIEYVYDDEGNVLGTTHYWEQLVFTGKTGKVTLTATANDGSGVKKSVTINVVKAPSMINLSTYEAKIAAGKPLAIKATPCIETGWNEVTETPILDTAVTDKTVIWSFGDPDAAAAIGAKISGGKLTTNAKLVTEPVTLEIIATAKLGIYDSYFDEYSYASATCYVTVYPATTNVTLHRFGKAVTGTLNLDKDSYAVLHAEGSPANAYTWKTSNAKIATIENNADGSVTVRPTGKLGTVTITATAADGTNKSAKVSLKILEKIDSLEIAAVGVAATKSVNLNNFLTINPSNATMKKVTWSWASEWDAEYAAELKVTLNANGTLSAAKLKNLEYPVDLEVRAVAADGLGAQKYAYVTIYPATTKVELFDAETMETVSGTVTLDVIEAMELGAVADPEAAQNSFKWTTSNAKVATIEVIDGVCVVVPTGKVGSAVIKATATDGTNKSAQVTVKVTKAVHEVSIPEDQLLSVAKGKTVTLSKSVVFNPTDASNKGLTWSMKLWNEETQAFDLEVPKTVATLNATSGALKCVNVTDVTAVEVTFTSKDGFGASGSKIVVLAPYAVKGVQILDQDENDLTRKTYETSNGSAKLYVQATNDPATEMCVSDFTWTVSNKNFEVVWDGEFAVVKPVEGAANPFGTVKVTFKATDGSNVSNYTTINFVPAT